MSEQQHESDLKDFTFYYRRGPSVDAVITTCRISHDDETNLIKLEVGGEHVLLNSETAVYAAHALTALAESPQ